ncbi:MAG: hypothetical protein AAFR76_00725, partial [Planctomycetota bacterium]
LTIAIERGVPLFNNNQAAACAAVYEVAIRSVLLLEGGLAEDQRSALNSALNAGRQERDARERAWIFRRGMDRLLPAQDGGRAMLTSTRRDSH